MRDCRSGMLLHNVRSAESRAVGGIIRDQFRSVADLPGSIENTDTVATDK